MNRRSFLTGLGSVSILVTGSFVYRAYDQRAFYIGQGPDFEAWHSWRSDAVSGPLRLVRAAILAANPHNTQPWLFRVNADSVTLFADRSRHLGAMDPYFREMYLGLGCAIENMVLAARTDGYACEVLLAGGSLIDSQLSFSQPVATLRLSPGSSNSNALYEAIPNRHTNRAAYDARPIAARLMETAVDFTRTSEIELIFITSPADKQSFAQGTVHATQAIIADRQMSSDSHRWFRMSQREMDLYRDGVTLEGAGLSPLVLRLAKILPPVSAQASDQVWLSNTRDIQVATAAAFGFVLVRQLYDQATTLQAGRACQRLHLWATTQGLAMQPMNQLVERVDRERQLGHPAPTANKLAELISCNGWQPTFAFRMGYPTQQALAVPRRPVDQVFL